jgi:hypothetical protein
MTVSTTECLISYTESTATEYPVPFRFLSASDLVVVRRIDGIDVPLDLGSDYSVSGADAETGGMVTRLIDAAEGAALIIRRATPEIQPTDYVANDRFPAESHERGLDRVTLMSQESREIASRALTVRPGESGIELPLAGDRKGLYLAFDAAGRPVPALGTGADLGLRGDLAEPSGSALLGYDPGSIGSEPRVLVDKLRERIDVEDYRLATDTSDAGTIQRALDALPADGGTLHFANGRSYHPNKALFVANKKRVILEGNGASLTRAFVGAAAEANVIEFIICELVVMRNFGISGENETYGGLESDSHNIGVYGCKRVLLENVVSAYAVCDGLYVNRFLAGTTRHGVTSIATYVTEHVTLINFHSDYSFRQGYSEIAAKSLTAIECSFNNTGRSSAGGTAPNAGVDLESNVGGIYAPDRATFMGCDFINNVGAGLTGDHRGCTLELINCLIERNGSNGLRSFSPNAVARLCIFRANGVGGGSPRAQVQSIDTASGVKVRATWLLDNCIFEAAVWGDFQIVEGVAARIKQCRFEGGANFAIRVGTNVVTRALQGAIEIEDVYIAGKTSDSPPGSPAYVMLSGAQVPISIKNLALNQQIVRLGNTTNGSATVLSVQNTFALKVGMGVSGSGIPGGTTIATIDPNGSTITLSAAATATASNVTLEFSSATPLTTGLTLGTPADLQEVVGVDFKGTGWVTKQDGGMLRAKYIANNKDDGVINDAYNLAGSATYDPPSIADGDAASTTVTVTGAALGDFAEVSLSVSNQGLIIGGRVTASNTVTVRYQNETGGAIDLASHTISIKVRKK